MTPLHPSLLQYHAQHQLDGAASQSSESDKEEDFRPGARLVPFSTACREDVAGNFRKRRCTTVENTSKSSDADERQFEAAARLKWTDASTIVEASIASKSRESEANGETKPSKSDRGPVARRDGDGGRHLTVRKVVEENKCGQEFAAAVATTLTTELGNGAQKPGYEGDLQLTDYNCNIHLETVSRWYRKEMATIWWEFSIKCQFLYIYVFDSYFFSFSIDDQSIEPVIFVDIKEGRINSEQVLIN